MSVSDRVSWGLFPSDVELAARQLDHVSTHLLSIDIERFIVLLSYSLIRIALFLLFWLSSAADHRSLTPTTTPSHYVVLR